MPFPFKTYALCAYLLHTAWEVYLSLRQRATFYRIAERPDVIADYVTEAEFEKSRRYGKDRVNLGLVKIAADAALTVAVLHHDGLARGWALSGRILARTSASAMLNGETAQSVVFVLLFTRLMDLINLPLDVYGTFVIERRHGFSTITAGRYIRDKITAVLLTAILFPPLVAAFVKTVRWGGDSFYLYLLALLVLVQAFFITVYPAVIAPLFNKFNTLGAGTLRDKIEAVARRVNFPLRKIFVMDGSARSAHSNAYQYGFGANKRIVLFDTLFVHCSESEIVAILAHEIGHWSHGHMLKNMVAANAHLTLLFYTFSLVHQNADLLRGFGFPPGVAAASPVIPELMLYITLYEPVEAVVGFCMTLLSRRFEFQSDTYAARLGKGAELIDGLKKITIKNGGWLCSDNLYAMWKHSHPGLLERIRNIERSKPKDT